MFGGGSNCSIGALTPVLALFGGIVCLCETITNGGATDSFLVAIGVILASWVFEKKTLSDLIIL